MLRDQNEFPTIMLAGIQEIQNVTQELSAIDYGYCRLHLNGRGTTSLYRAVVDVLMWYVRILYCVRI